MRAYRRRFRLLLGLLATTAVVVAGAVTTSPAGAVGADAAEGVLPICAPSTTADPNWSITNTAWKQDVFGWHGTDYVEQWIGMGLAQNCAYQSYYAFTRDCITCPWSTDATYHPFVAGRAFPETLDAAGGDHQRVTITMPGTSPEPRGNGAAVGWGPCYPGFEWRQPYVVTGCDPTAWNWGGGDINTNLGLRDAYPERGGQVIYRVRNAAGRFEGPWTSSLGDANPGFHLQHVGAHACDGTVSSCDFEIIFARDVAGHLLVGKDIQLVITLAAEAVMPDGLRHDSRVAVPMLVIQSDGTAGPANPSPSVTPTSVAPTSAAASTAVPAPVTTVPVAGGAATASQIPVFRTPVLPKKETVAAAKALLRKNKLAAGDVVAPKGYPKADRKHRWVVTQFLLQTSTRVRVHGKWTTVHRYTPLRAGQVVPKGAVLALKVALQKA